MDKLAEGYRYTLFSEQMHCQDNGIFTAYGIECKGQGVNERVTYPNISSCSDIVEVLLERLNRHRVPAAHFGEIVEDYLDELFSQ